LELTRLLTSLDENQNLKRVFHVDMTIKEHYAKTQSLFGVSFGL
jgi:hypothetical protein